MKKIYALLFALVSLLATATAQAANGDIYGGIGYNFNTLDSGPRLFGGYTFLKNRWTLANMPVSLGAELTYLDIGTGWVSTYVKDKEYGVFATAVGSMRVAENLDVLARVGLGWGRGKETDTLSGITQTSTGTEPMIGIGATYKFQPNLGVRADLEHYSGEFQSADAVTASIFASF